MTLLCWFSGNGPAELTRTSKMSMAPPGAEDVAFESYGYIGGGLCSISNDWSPPPNPSNTNGCCNEESKRSGAEISSIVSIVSSNSLTFVTHQWEH